MGTPSSDYQAIIRKPRQSIYGTPGLIATRSKPDFESEFSEGAGEGFYALFTGMSCGNHCLVVDLSKQPFVQASCFLF